MDREPPAREAFSAACRMLARRSHSRMELKQKLERKGYSPEAVAATLDRLCQQGYLDDLAIARRWAEHLAGERLCGRGRITAYLLQKGVDRDILDAVQQELWQRFSEEDLARRALQKRFAGPAPTGKAVTFLKSRGFSAEVIYRLAGKDPGAADDRY
jgi:regulatory protein